LASYTVTSPLLPELVTEGDTVDEALHNVNDALTAVIGHDRQHRAGIQAFHREWEVPGLGGSIATMRHIADSISMPRNG